MPRYLSTDPSAGDPVERTTRTSSPAAPRRRYLSTDPLAGETAEPVGPEGSAASRFAGGVWRNVNPVTMATGLVQLAAHPVKAVEGAIAASREQGAHAEDAKGRAEGSWNRFMETKSPGDYATYLRDAAEYGGRALASKIPLLGPAAAAAGEKIGAGDVAGGLGEGVGMLAAPAAGRAAVRGGVALARKAAAPLAGAVNRPIVEAAARQGVELPASALSDSKVVAVAEGLAARGIGGGGAARRFSDASAALTLKADHLVKRATKLGDSSEVGRVVAEGLNNYRAHWTRTKNALYEQAALPEKGMRLQAGQTVGVIDEILKGKSSAAQILGSASDAGFYQSLRNGLTKVVNRGGQKVRVLKDLEAKDLLAAQRELTQKIAASFADPVSAANKGALKKVAATMDDELTAAIKQQAPDLAAKLETANAAYIDGITRINSAFGKNIHRLAKSGQYDKIASTIVNSRASLDDIPKILEMAGPEGAQGMRGAVLADIVSKAKGAGGQLTPQGLSRAMKTFGEDRLSALLDPKQLAQLKDISTLSNALQKGQKVMEGSQTAFSSRMAAYGAGVLVNPLLTLKALAGEAAFSRFISSGVGQKWLTGGFKPLSSRTSDALAQGVSSSARITPAAARLPEPVAQPLRRVAEDTRDEERRR